MKNLKTLSVLLALGLALSAAGFSFAQPYPSKPVRLIVPFAAGSSTDIIARIISQKLTESLGQQVVVDNRPGANGIIAADAAAKAAPDGYTLFMGTSSTQGVNISLFNKLPYDPVRDFIPITQVGNVAYFLVVGGNLPVNSVKELVALAKANPGKRTLASTASVSQLAGELFKLTAGIDMTIVPYKTPSTAFIDLASGQVDALFDGAPSSLPQIKGGRLKALGVTSAKRSALLPEVPTIAESGYPGFEAGAWVGFFAPAGTPKEIIARMHTEVVKVLQTPEVKEKLLQNATEVIASTPEQLGEAVKAEIARWSRVVKEAHIPKIN